MSRMVSAAALVLAGCVCGPGEASCGQQCSNLLDDPQNCGGCGRACSYLCVNGACIATPECGPAVGGWDCNDGLSCNGVEHCEQGADGAYRCIHGTPMNCSDGVRCTTDTCSDGVCTSTPIDSACASGQMCDATAGCIARCDHPGCGLVEPQCGCATGQACLATGLTPTCGTPGHSMLGARCFAPGDCAAGLDCVAIAADFSVRMCMAFCDDDTDCSPTDPSCTGEGMYSSDEPQIGVCSPNCDLATSSGCPSSAKCVRFQDSASSPDYTGCDAPVGTGGLDSPCTDDTSCGRGYLCLRITSTGAHVCRQWCRTSSDCATGTCRPVTPAIVVNGISYGACQ